jgi:hypothetical protein
MMSLNVMRRGATLHLTLADKPTWKLNNGVTEVTVNSRAVQSMLKRGAIVGNGDSLFSDIPSQTFRFRPHLHEGGANFVSPMAQSKRKTKRADKQEE